METFVRPFVVNTSLLIEGAAALLVAFAALRAFIFSLMNLLGIKWRAQEPLEIRLGLGRWLALALEFLVAADILRTSVAPTWGEIGRLAAIVAVRTALNFFLEREVREGRKENAAERESTRQLARRPV